MLLKDIIGNEFIDQQNNKMDCAEAIGKAEFIAIYTSAYWSACCREYTQILSQVYNEIDKKKVQIIFTSCDQNIEQYIDSYKRMPWISIPYESEFNEKLQNIDGKIVKSIPKITMMKKDGTVIHQRKITSIMKSKEEFNEWLKKMESEMVADDITKHLIIS